MLTDKDAATQAAAVPPAAGPAPGAPASNAPLISDSTVNIPVLDGAGGPSRFTPDDATSASAQRTSDSASGTLALVADAIPGYAIERELHRGGQGVVYLAKQKATRRDVAIKVMREGPFAGAADLARFEREVRILAQLKHPNIVAIHDSGTAAGNFYYVMDFIDGIPPDKWVMEARGGADRAKKRLGRPIEETLRVFVKICDAVNAAHMRGVIHRDLKPGNILIDRADEPHILDFGLAKMTGEDGTGVTTAQAMTMAGQFVGSLPWASPEQAEGRPDKIDVRTDVYSLGVILYQMLTGVFPYEITGSIQHVLSNILRHEPVRPSALQRHINDEIETIVLKCLSKERERRYQTAGEVAADIQRYLAGEPIEAKRDSGWYVLRKSIRRYKWALAIAGVFMVAGFAFGAVMAMMYGSARRELSSREAIEANAARADAEAREALVKRRLYATRISLAAGKYAENEVTGLRELLDECAEPLRGWEWSRLSWLSDRSIATLKGHEHFVTAVAYRPDGRQLASASYDNTLKLWDTDDGVHFRETPALRGHDRPVLCVAYSPDGKFIASGGQDATVRIWDTATHETKLTLSGHWSHVSALAYSPDGAVLVSASQDQTVRLWNTADGKELKTIEPQAGALAALAIVDKGQAIACGGENGLVRLFSVPSGAMIRDGGFARVGIDALADGGSAVICALADGTIQRWDESDIVPMRGHSGRVTGLALRGRRMLVSSGEDRTLRMWDLNGGNANFLTLRGHLSGVECVAVAPDGRYVASGGRDNVVRVWNAAAAEEMSTLTGHYGGVRSVSLNTDGTRLVSGGSDFSIKLWDADSGEELRTLRGHEWAVRGTAFLPRGASAGGDQIVSAGDDGTVRIWDVAKGDAIRVFKGHEKSVNCVAVSPAGGLIASGGQDGTTRLWRAAGQKSESGAASGADAIAVLRGHTGDVISVAFSPDSSLLVTGGNDKTVRIWDVNSTAAAPRTLSAHDGPVTAVCFSPDAKSVISGSADTTLRLWNVADGRERATFRGHTQPVRAVAWLADGLRIVSGGDDQRVRIWDPAAGEEVLGLRGHSQPVSALAVSADGARIVSAGQDGAILIWEKAELSPTYAALRSRTSAARRWVDAEFRARVFAADAEQALAATPDDSGPLAEEVRHVREIAVRIVRARGDNPQQLNDGAWAIVRSPGRDSDTYRNALRMAQRACELAPQTGSYLNTLGIALCRVQQYDDALVTLRESTRRNGEHPADVAFVALATHKLGQVEESRAHLERLRVLMKQPWYAREELWQGFLREVEVEIVRAGPVHE